MTRFLVHTHMDVIPRYMDFLSIFAILRFNTRAVAMVPKRPASRRTAMKAMKVMNTATKSASIKFGGNACFLVVLETPLCVFTLFGEAMRNPLKKGGSPIR